MAESAAPVATGRPKQEERRPRHWHWALAGVVAVAVLLFVLWWGPWFFTLHPSSELTDAEELKAENDVRTTLVQTAGGLILAGGLIVTYRTFLQNQRDQRKRWNDQERTYQLTLDNQVRTFRLNLAAQVNATYSNAVEQLGHDEAPVRLGALHSLASLAQDNPSRRQTVVDVLCAYLRMPYTPPTKKPPTTDLATAENAGPANPDEEARKRDAAQELQVRQTAQRLLADHLRRLKTTGEGPQTIEAASEETFWPDISVDLNGAVLVDFDFNNTSLTHAVFDGATFSGNALFADATFSGPAWFERATFSSPAWFLRARFSSNAHFYGASFSFAHFQGATFSGAVTFYRATFSNYVDLGGTRLLRLSDPTISVRTWPRGWVVRQDADDPTRGTLIRSEQSGS